MKEFKDYDKETQEYIKELVLTRIKEMPYNMRLCIG